MKGIEHADEIVRLYDVDKISLRDVQLHFRAKSVSLKVSNITDILRFKGVEIRTHGEQLKISCARKREQVINLDDYPNIKLIKKLSRAMYAANDSRRNGHYYCSFQRQ